jgi:hypothetical protein
MQRIAALMFASLLGCLLTSSVTAQIITAQPARPFNPSPSYGNYQTAYSAPTAAPSVLQSPEANTIRGWYRDYLGRDVGQDVSALVNLLRGGMSSTDLQATILGSDEFYWQKGRDPQTFVRETLQAVTWTEPSYAELQRWTDRLNQLRGDRFALAREILQSNNQPLSQASQLGDLVTRLSSASRLAVDTIDFEIGGTAQGNQARLQAQALLTAANQLQQTTTLASTRPADLTLALNSADRAYQALQSTLSNPPGTAPSAAGVVRRIGTMLADTRSAAGLGLSTTGPSFPPLGSTLPGNGAGSWGYDPRQLLDQISAARRATESLIQTLTSQAYQDYSYNIVLRDLDTLAARLAGLEPLVRSGTSRERIGWEVDGVADSAERIRTQLGTNRLPYSARLFWQSVDSSLAQIRETVGATGRPTSTTLLRPTTLHESLLPLLDEAASQIDVFIAGTMPLVYMLDVPSVQVDSRSLKNRVLLLRQQAGTGQPASVLKQTLSGMVGDYQDAFDRWNRIVAASRLTNPARLSPVGETLNRVEQLINQALTSGDLSPSGPTRVTQDLALLNGEVADARRGLSRLAGYREQQSIDLYLEQLSGYVQQLNDVLTRPSSLDARRLAVGMQGVIGRMQADADSLNQRVVSAPTPTIRQTAADLQLRISRIGRLVDDVEAQLY